MLFIAEMLLLFETCLEMYPVCPGTPKGVYCSMYIYLDTSDC